MISTPFKVKVKRNNSKAIFHFKRDNFSRQLTISTSVPWATIIGFHV